MVTTAALKQSRALVEKSGANVLHRSQMDTSTYATQTSLDSVTRECIVTLLTLLDEISPKLQPTLPAAMIGHIVLSTVCDQVTSLQVALRQGWGPTARGQKVMALTLA